jgi:hypothetical protein
LILVDYRFFSVALTFLLGICTVVADSAQGKTLLSNTSPHESQPRYGQTQTSDANSGIAKLENTCLKIRRPLNPSATPQHSETNLDRTFRLAYNAEVEGDFDTAIINYRRATKLATCDCDRLHAQAGEQAAKEAKALLKTEGEASKPTQFFWGRLQELTKSLSCVIVQ